MKTLIPLAAALVAGSASAQDLAANKEIALAALNAVFVSFDAGKAEALIAEDYIQHNPAVPTGRAPILGFIPALKDSGITLDVHRVLAEGDLVVLHSTYGNAGLFGADTLVGFDVFRIENGKVAEHWDNLAPVSPPNPSGRSQVDGPSAVTDPGATEASKALVTAFVTDILINGDMGKLPGYFDGDAYIQHNSQIADGLSGLGAALEHLASQGIEMRYGQIHQVIAEGEFVFVMSEGAFGGAPTAFFDLWRVENGKIAEHWDVVSEIPAEFAHENGKF